MTMKRLMVVCLLCAYFNGFTQRWQEPPNSPMPNSPLIVVDGHYRLSDLNFINSNEILKVDTLGNIFATVIYGKEGSYGALLITTSRKNYDNKELTPFTKYPSKIIYNNIVVVNNSASERGLIGISISDLLDFEFTKNTDLNGKTGPTVSSKLAITTISYAITEYQKKFGTFSKEYKTYLDSCKCNGTRFLYVIDGVPLKLEGIRKTTAKLYDLPEKGIRSVKFMDTNFQIIYENKAPIVLITTQKP